jgi:acetyl esterase/lipase
MIRTLLLLTALTVSATQTLAWQPAAGLVQIPLWPGAAPFAARVTKPETVTSDPKSLIGGKPVAAIYNVSRPTLTLYPPKGKDTGVTVVVYPGGGYEILAVDLEGTEICDWLTAKGIRAVLLKYRVPGHPGPHRTSPMALADAQRAMGLLRQHAKPWHIDPHKLGVLGFSAGGHLAVAMSTQFARRTYSPIDPADRESCRPDFAVPIYPGHLAVDQSDEPPARRKLTTFKLQEEGQLFGLNPDVRVPHDAPPTFLLQDEDDPVDRVENSLLYFAALRKAGLPVEMHLYAQGGHAFGLRPTRFPVTRWPALVETWLRTIKMLPSV